MSTPAGPAPSVRVDEERPSWLPWVIGLLLVALLAVVLFFLLADDEDDQDVDVAADPAATQLDAPDVDADTDVDAAPGTDASASATPAATAGAGASDSPFVLTPPFDGLAEQQGMQVSGTQLSVVDVPADEAFTIGTAEDELLVHITPAARTGAESDANVQPGSTVASLQGTVEPVTEEFLTMRGLTGEQAETVRQRGFYVAATAFELAP